MQQGLISKTCEAKEANYILYGSTCVQKSPEEANLCAEKASQWVPGARRARNDDCTQAGGDFAGVMNMF